MEHVTKKVILGILIGIIMTLSVISMTTCSQQAEQGEPGIPGVDGTDGLTPTIGENGNWWIGDRDTGVVAKAKDGKDGSDGKDGLDGKNGVDGKDGKDAITPKFLYNNGMIYVSYDNEVSWVLLVEVDKLIEDGKDGKDGVSITSCEINDSGELIIYYSTGESDNLGNIVGKNGNNGTDGLNGTNGISVTSCIINDSGELVISYSNGNSENLGKVVGTNGVNGTNGATPRLQINTDTHQWEVSYDNGETWNALGVIAMGADGTNGITPRLQINTDTRQWEVSYDNGETWVSLGVVAIGTDGTNGVNGITPRLQINAYTNQWEISYDNGETWKSLGVVATGPAGNDGIATIVKIGDDGYWYTSRDNGTNWENTGVKAKGSDGVNGNNGNDGRGIDKMEIIDGCLWVTYTDNATPVNIGRVSSAVEGGGSGSDAVVTEPYTDGLAFYPLGDGSEYGVSVGNALYMETIVIPSTYNGKPVTTILPRAFVRVDDTNTTLKNIVIPNSIVSIGDNAFDNCVALSNLTIPSSVIEIGDYAFANLSIVTFEISESEIPEGQEWNEGTLGCGEIAWKK